MKNKEKIMMVLFTTCVLLIGIFVGGYLKAYDVKATLTDRTTDSVNFYEDWKGKKVAWYGDSLTELYYHCDIVNNYYAFEGYNCGLRGCAISAVNDNGTNLYQVERAKLTGYAIPDDTDVIMVMAGTNDWCANVELGVNEIKFDGNGKLISDTSTFYGACNAMFDMLVTNYPNAYILVMGTPPIFNDVYDMYNEIGLTAIDYGKALCNAASLWGIQSFNISEMLGIHPHNGKDSDGLMYEGLHFTEGAGRIAADIIIQELSTRRYTK